MPDRRYGATLRVDGDPLPSSSVPPITGTEAYLGTHIAKRTLDLSVFGDDFTGIEIVSALPPLPDPAYTQGKVVFLTSDNKLYRSTGSTWTAVVPTTDLSGQIVETQIAVNAVTADKILAGSVTAAKISVSTLSSIQADIGEVTAGKLRNAADTAGILLTGSLPGGWTRYVNFAASGANPVFKHEKMSLNADGTASFAGLLDITNAPLSVGFGGAFIVFRDSDVAHGMTSQVPTDVLGIITAADDLQGGWNVVGWAESTATAASFQGYNVTASSSNPIVRFDGGKKSGTTVVAAAATDLMFSFANFGTRSVDIFGDGLVYIGTRTTSGLTIQSSGPSTRRPLFITQGSLESGSLEAILVNSTWNTAGTPTLIKADVVDTSSPAGSLLLDLQVGSTSKFKVQKDGLVTIAAGGLTVTAGNTTLGASLIFTTAAGKIIPGATSLALRNNADSADNILVSDAGVVTLRSNLVFTAAATKIIPGATSITFRNNADSVNNVIITDGGRVTVGERLYVTNYIVPSIGIRNSADTATLIQNTQRTGWGSPTGTATRTTFATGTVTLPQLAERVRAIIDDMKDHHQLFAA